MLNLKLLLNKHSDNVTSVEQRTAPKLNTRAKWLFSYNFLSIVFHFSNTKTKKYVFINFEKHFFHNLHHFNCLPISKYSTKHIYAIIIFRISFSGNATRCSQTLKHQIHFPISVFQIHFPKMNLKNVTIHTLSCKISNKTTKIIIWEATFFIKAFVTVTLFWTNHWKW